MARGTWPSSSSSRARAPRIPGSLGLKLPASIKRAIASVRWPVRARSAAWRTSLSTRSRSAAGSPSETGAHTTAGPDSTRGGLVAGASARCAESGDKDAGPGPTASEVALFRHPGNDVHARQTTKRVVGDEHRTVERAAMNMSTSNSTDNALRPPARRVVARARVGAGKVRRAEDLRPAPGNRPCRSAGSGRSPQLRSEPALRAGGGRLRTSSSRFDDWALGR